MEIAIIILCSLILVGLIVTIILLIKRKPVTSNPEQSIESLKEIAALAARLDTLSAQIKTDIKVAVIEETNKMLESSSKANELNNEKLERFQRNISDAINVRFDALNKQMNEKINELNKKVDERLAGGFKETSETIAQVRERLQAIDAAQKNIEDLSKDVVSLKNVLEGNQTRGQYGEYQLSMILHNVFGDAPRCYEEQYTLRQTKDGDTVRADAVVFMPEPNKLICIDSKFPFQDYSRMFDAESEEEKERFKKDFAAAVKKHITAIKDKYIIEGKTAPEAMIFIPNDGVFAYIHHELFDVVEFARERRVIITSPSTLPPMLATINMLKIEVERAKNIQEISKQLNLLGKQFELFAEEWDRFSRQLATATKTREDLDKRFTRISDRFEKISSVTPIEEIEENKD